MARQSQQRLPIQRSPDMDLPIIGPSGNVVSVWTEGHGDDAIDGFQKDRACQIRPREGGILGLSLLQISLPDRQLRAILALHMAVEPDQQIDDIACPIALRCTWQGAQLLEQAFQVCFQVCSAVKMSEESVEHRLEEELGLTAAQVVFGLGLEERMAEQDRRLALADFVAHLSDQSFTHIL